jgi:hypothetical protein
MDASSRTRRATKKMLTNTRVNKCGGRRSRELAKLEQNKIEPLIGVINDCIAQLSAAKLCETAELMRMARLDLMARAYGISEEELEIFAFALQRGGALK